MKTLTHLLCLSFIMGTLFSCSTEKRNSNDESKPAGLVEVTALDFKFEAPEEIPSGWTTFRFKNEGKQEHFLYMYRLPDGKNYDQFLEQAMVPFGSVWNEYASGEISREEVGTKLGSEMPGWYFTDMVPSGGPALTEPGETVQTTVKLDPGLYVIQCYVKMPDGSWHTEQGMQQAMAVSEENNGSEPPIADVELTLSNYEILSEGELKAGTQTIAVHVKENPEGFMLHDINLFRLDDNTKVNEIVMWMDWMDLEQFRAPAPAYSLGGVEHMVAGKTGYMTVDLKPGNYAWVSEGYANQGMVKSFSIPVVN